MGYQRMVQYGNIIEIYKYENNKINPRKRGVSKLSKKRAKNIRAHAKAKGNYLRARRSILRSVQSFYRLCHHNNILASTIHFVTLTFAYDLTIKEAHRCLSRFMGNIKKAYPEISLSYISVSELTKKGRYHFHLLMYDLSPKVAGEELKNEGYTTERTTRNLQRLFERGYVDVYSASYKTGGIAGYMAKYMAKTLATAGDEGGRGYTCSRNIKRPYSQGSNTLSSYDDIFIPTEGIDEEIEKSYDVPYLGKCLYSRVTLKKCTQNSKEN